jgi:hypothetical protein
MKNQNLYDLRNSITISVNLLLKNKQVIDEYIAKIEKPFEAKKPFIKYDEVREELAKKHAVKVKGKPQTQDGKFVIKDQEAFQADFEKLRKKYSKVIAVRTEQVALFKQELEKEAEITI